MENTEQSTTSARQKDKRQCANTNPDRPPIDPDQPNTPDPFDPFETALLADGGQIIQDSTELTFEKHFDTVLPTPEEPESPSIPTKTSDSKHGQNNDEIGATINNKRKRSFDPSPPEEDSLIRVTRSIIFNDSPDYSYVIQQSSQRDSLEHHAVKEGQTEIAITRENDVHYVRHYNTTNKFTDEAQTKEYDCFETAIAAFTEALDWGSLPPGTDNPHIWTYDGYSDPEISFIEYLAGDNKSTCGDHYFQNTAADYSIHIESYSDSRPDSDPNQTMAIMTLTNHIEYGKGKPFFRDRFPGQKQAFDCLLTALSEGLSNEISMHNGPFGDCNKIPPVSILTSDS